MKSILFIVPFPKKISPSARFRIEMYEGILKDNGFECSYSFFWSEAGSSILYKSGNILGKLTGFVLGYLRRVKTLFSIRKFDYIFILRETTPLGPPVFEWLYTKLFKKKIIYDFDDAIWVNQTQGSNAWVGFLKSFWKVKEICKWAHLVSAGNRFLYDYAINYNPRVVINPTCVDTDHKHNIIKDQNTEKIVIGWTGSFSQLRCLDEVTGVLMQLEKKYDFEFIVIADKNPGLRLKNYTFIKWNELTEINDLLKLNIGIMPLPDDDFSRGKCGFKLIQFMALGIPVVASPLEVNALIVDHSENGFLASTQQEWYHALEKLLNSGELREEMGRKGRDKIIQHYSLESNKANFLSLFQ